MVAVLRGSGHDQMPASASPASTPVPLGFTLGVPYAFAIAPDGSRDRLSAGAVRAPTAAPACGCGTPQTGAERAGRRPARSCCRGTEELRPKNGRGGSGPGRRGGRGGVRGRRRGGDRGVRAVRPAVRGRSGGGRRRPRTAPGPPCARWPPPTRCSTRAPTRPGAHIAYVADGALRVVAANGGSDRALAVPEAENVTYGLAEFVAAEEMDRTRGFWWSPDGQRLLVARVDTTPVARWYIRDPANPDRAPRRGRLPGRGHRERRRQRGDRRAGREPDPGGLGLRRRAVPDLGALVAAAAPRCCRCARGTSGRCGCWRWPTTARTELVGEDTDPDWVDVVPGTPGLDAGRRAGPGGRPRRRVPADDRRRAGDADGPERPRGPRRRATTSCSPPPARTRPSSTSTPRAGRHGPADPRARRAPARPGAATCW